MTRRREMLLKKSGGGRLPDEFQEVEYIRNLSMNGLIDTQIIVSQKTGCEISFRMISSTSSGNFFLLGMFDAGKSRFNPFFTSSTIIATCPQISWRLQEIAPIDTEKHTATFNKTLGVIEYDDVLSPYPVGNFCIETTSSPLLLYSRTTGNSSYAEAYLYSCKIYEDEQIIAEMIPCYRKADDMIGVYDIVRNDFFAVNNNSIFDKGDDV